VRKPLIIAFTAGAVIGALAWIDPIFVPLVLAGPPISGALAAGKGIAFRWVATAWVVAGISMLVSDWVLNTEDRVFHVAITAIMVALASIGWGTVRVVRRRSGIANAS
jgi:hypothetical protein